MLRLTAALAGHACEQAAGTLAAGSRQWRVQPHSLVLNRRSLTCLPAGTAAAGWAAAFVYRPVSSSTPGQVAAACTGHRQAPGRTLLSCKASLFNARTSHMSPTHRPQVLVSLTAADGSSHRLPAAIVSRDPSHELIVLRVEPPEAGLRPIALGSSAGLRVGQDALLVGALPGGGGPTLAAGAAGGRAGSAAGSVGVVAGA